MQSKNIHTQLNIQFPSLEDALNLRKGDLSGTQDFSRELNKE